MSENVLPIFSSRSCMMSCLILRYLNHFELIIIYRWGNVLISLIYMFFGRTDAKAETPILWLPHAKSWLIGKVSDAGRDWGQEEKGTTENEMAGWHHWLNGHEFGWTPGVGDGQGGLASCDSWGRKESDTNEQLNWTDWTVQLFQHLLLKTVFSPLYILVSFIVDWL